MHLSPRPTLIISFILGWTAKSLIPHGTLPGGAVSPVGLPCALGWGALTVETTFQSRILVTDIVLSSAADSNLDLDGKYSAVILDEWWRRVPISRFFGFSRILFPAKVETEGYRSLTIGGAMEIEYIFIRSSEPPVAKNAVCGWEESVLVGGDSASVRIADVCAWNRKVSANDLDSHGTWIILGQIGAHCCCLDGLARLVLTTLAIGSNFYSLSFGHIEVNCRTANKRIVVD